MSFANKDCWWRIYLLRKKNDHPLTSPRTGRGYAKKRQVPSRRESRWNTCYVPQTPKLADWELLWKITCTVARMQWPVTPRQENVLPLSTQSRSLPLTMQRLMAWMIAYRCHAPLLPVHCIDWLRGLVVLSPGMFRNFIALWGEGVGEFEKVQTPA